VNNTLNTWENEMNEYHLKAYAKINLGLDVIGRLPNGYHQVKMIMQSIGLWDELTIRKTPEHITITTDTDQLPTNEDNLIYKAAKLMLEKYNIESGVHIHLRKNIPIAAGLAGGSTDAAATMTGISRLFGLDIPLARLMEHGVAIGADVPYCLMGGTALAEGIGERLTALPPVPDCYVLVAKPDIMVSTKYVYEHLDAADAMALASGPTLQPGVGSTNPAQQHGSDSTGSALQPGTDSTGSALQPGTDSPGPARQHDTDSSGPARQHSTDSSGPARQPGTDSSGPARQPGSGSKPFLQHPDIDGMAEAIRSGSLSGILPRLGNVLETVTIPAYPVIADIKRRMLEYGASGSLMSGSGPTVFGIFPLERQAEARAAYERLLQDGLAKQIFLVTLRTPA